MLVNGSYVLACGAAAGDTIAYLPKGADSPASTVVDAFTDPRVGAVALRLVDEHGQTRSSMRVVTADNVAYITSAKVDCASRVRPASLRLLAWQFSASA